MPEYRVYNPTNSEGIHESQFVNFMPNNVRDIVRSMVDASLERGITPANWEAAMNDAMNSRLQDLSDLIGEQGVADALDAWAVEASFDPDRVVVDEAYWVGVDTSGHQVAVRAHLSDDDMSPNGYAWYLDGYEWIEAEGRWANENLGAFWGFHNAYELENEWDAFGDVEWDYLDVVRVPIEYAESLNLDAVPEDLDKPRKVEVGRYHHLEDRLRDLAERIATPSGPTLRPEYGNIAHVPATNEYNQTIAAEWFGDATAHDGNVWQYGDMFAAVDIDVPVGDGRGMTGLQEDIADALSYRAYLAVERPDGRLRVYTTLATVKELHDRLSQGLELECKALAALAEKADLSEYDAMDWGTEADRAGDVDWNELDRPLFPNLLPQLDVKRDDLGRMLPPEGAFARAGRYDISVTMGIDVDDGSPIIAASFEDTMHAFEPVTCTAKVYGNGYSDIIAAQYEAYDQLYREVGNWFNGVQSSIDGHGSLPDMNAAFEEMSASIHPPAWHVQGWALKSSAYEDRYFDVSFTPLAAGEEADAVTVAFEGAQARIAADDPWSVAISDSDRLVRAQYSRNAGWSVTDVPGAPVELVRLVEQANLERYSSVKAYTGADMEEYLSSVRTELEDKIAGLESDLAGARAESAELRDKLHDAEQVVLLPGETYEGKYGRRAPAPDKGPAPIEKPKLEVDKKRALESSQAQSKSVSHGIVMNRGRGPVQG